MIRLRYAACAAPPALAALLLAACSREGGGSDAKIELRYHPPAGAVYHYTLEQRSAVSMESGPLAQMGTQQLVMVIHFTQTVKGPAAQGTGGGGGTEVQVTFDSTSMELPGVPPAVVERELARLRGLKGTVVFDARAQVVRSDFAPVPGVPPEMAAQMAAGIKAMTFAFPEQPVGRGDAWTIATELPMGQLPGADAARRGAGPATTTLTVREVRISGADTTVVLAVKTVFPTDPIELNFEGQKATLRLNGSLEGNQRFSVSRGAVLEGTLNGTMKMNVTAQGLGSQAMGMSSDTENTLRLKDSSPP